MSLPEYCWYIGDTYLCRTNARSKQKALRYLRSYAPRGAKKEALSVSNANVPPPNKYFAPAPEHEYAAFTILNRFNPTDKEEWNRELFETLRAKYEAGKLVNPVPPKPKKVSKNVRRAIARGCPCGQCNEARGRL